MNKNTQLYISYTIDNQPFNLSLSFPNTLKNTLQTFEHMEVQLTYKDLSVPSFGEKQEKKT